MGGTRSRAWVYVYVQIMSIFNPFDARGNIALHRSASLCARRRRIRMCWRYDMLNRIVIRILLLLIAYCGGCDAVAVHKLTKNDYVRFICDFYCCCESLIGNCDQFMFHELFTFCFLPPRPGPPRK